MSASCDIRFATSIVSASVALSDCGSSWTTSFQAAQHRAQLKQARHAGRRGLGPHHEPPRNHRGENLIEDAGALSLVGAATRECKEIRDIPDDLLF